MPPRAPLAKVRVLACVIALLAVTGIGTAGALGNRLATASAVAATPTTQAPSTTAAPLVSSEPEAAAAPTTLPAPSTTLAAPRVPDPLAASFTEVQADVAPVDVAPPAAVGSGVWAVVIGIDDYPGTSHDLRAAVADADETVRALNDYGVADDHILLLRNGEATAAAILDASDWLVANAGPDATAVFAYAGHMRAVNACCTEAIVGADGRLVPDYRLAEHLKTLEAKHTWFLLASCYSGGFTEVLGPGRVLTAAAQWNQLAYESDEYGHSYLTEFLVHRAMREGFAASTVQESFNWAADQIHRESPGHEPVMIVGAGPDPGPLVLGPTIVRTVTDPAAGGNGANGSNAPYPTTTTTTAPATTTTTAKSGRCIFCTR